MPEAYGQSKSVSLLVGGITLLVCMLLVVAFALGTSEDILDTKDDYVVLAYYNEIGSLEKGAPVKYGGVKIGHVTEIALQDDLRIRVEAKLLMSQEIPKNSSLSIAATTVSGDTYLNLMLGTSSKVIDHTDNTVEAPELIGINFISIGNIGSAFTGVQTLVAKTIINIQKITGKDSRSKNEIKSITNRLPSLKRKYSSLEERGISIIDKIKTVQEEIKKIHANTNKVKDKVFSLRSRETITRDLKVISKSSQELGKLLNFAMNNNELTTIKDNFTTLSKWAASLKMEKNSVLGVLLRDDCNGAKKTVKMIGNTIQKVQDFSIFKKLGFYFDGKKLLSNFEKRTHANYLTAAAYMYKWSLFSYKRNLHNCDLPSGAKNCPKALK